MLRITAIRKDTAEKNCNHFCIFCKYKYECDYYLFRELEDDV